jgi:hypothetical protein
MKPFTTSAAPAAAPATARTLLARTDLSREEKVEILHQWEVDLREAMVAEEENMPGPEDEALTLGEVLDALRTLGAHSAFQDAPTKHG